MTAAHPAVAGVAIAAVAALVVAGEIAGAAEPSGATAALTAPVAIGCLIMGALVAGAAPGRRVGGLLLAAGVVACVAVVALSWSRWLPLAWLGQWSWWPPYALVFLALLVFPDGRLPSRRWRVVAAAIAVGTAVATAALGIAALDHPRDLLTDVIDFSDRARLLVRVAAVGVAVTVIGMIATVYSQWLRWRRARGTARHQLACLLAAGLVFLLGLVLDAANLPGAQIVAGLSIPLGMTVAMLRHRLYGLDQVVNRVIVWSAMTILVIVGFVALVAVLRAVVTGERTSMTSLAVTGLIAVLFEPLRRLVQRGVDRLLFGDRDDPYRVIARLGDLIGRTVEPNAVLPTLTGTIARSLQVPYVAVRLPAEGTPQLITEHGSATTDVELFDMTLHGRRVGRLLVATRGPDSPFTGRERRLLSQLAVQAAAAAEAARLIRELQDARERLVRTREEERRRLRRDLHDGLGPALAGMSMQVAAAKTLAGEPPRVGRILAALADDLRTCTGEVRRLVDELRPPALDDGLEAALRDECRRLSRPGFSVRLHVEPPLADLPAAVEVAAYRIVAEAVTNAARHAEAAVCTVTVGRPGPLVIEVTDDGVGLDGAAPRHNGSGSAVGGVGLGSMRERAAELGGACEVTTAQPHGTTVVARLPLHLATPSEVAA